MLLLSIDSDDGPAEILAPASFHLHEDKRVAIATDDIDLTTAAPSEIAVENFVSLLPKETAGEFFTERAATDMLRQFLRAREVAAPPVRKTGDGSDKAQIHEV